MKPIDASEPQATGRLRPPGLSLLLAEVRGILEFNASLMLSPLLMGAPRGDGHPVLTLPGFLASDLSMAPMRRYLKELGYDAYAWNNGRNIGGVLRMRAALRHQLQVQGERPVFRAGDLSVDLVRRIVKVGEREVKLSPKEYELLRVLVQHAGKVLTHRFLLKELWDELTDAQYLRVYVRQLRQKIEADPERPQFVLTETGIGYRLRAPD